MAPAASQDSGSSKDHGAKQAGGGEPKRKRARSVSVVGGGAPASASAGVRGEKKGSSTTAAASAPAASPAQPESAAGSLPDVTVEDADALDCGVCFLPLKAPIFQVLYSVHEHTRRFRRNENNN
jgi:E3 ubiquitin-protein ligase SIAH1